MKIPLNWLQDYVDLDKTPAEIAASFTQIGLMLDKPLDDSGVLDLEHRMDRSDWLSIVGCARDLAAFENIKLKEPKLYTKPGQPPTTKYHIPITVQTPAVRRFQTRVFKGIKVGPSPKWLVDRLTLYGMETKNNIVDITNYVMVEYGQTMHAQDLAKLPGSDITIRPAKSGEKLTTLLGTVVTLDPATFILTSGGVATVIGGIVGGKLTGVSDSTIDIILDAGNYDSRIIRQNSRRLKIINESVNRNDKFLDPRLIDIAMARATELILELAGGTYYDNDDYYPSPISPSTQTLHFARLKLLSGLNISTSTVKRILKSLCYQIIEENELALTVEIPYFRTDIEVEDDLVADVLRIYDYANLPVLPLNTPVPVDITQDIYRFEDRLRDLLVAQGAHEHITTPLVLASVESDQIKLANALSTDQNALRTSIVPQLALVSHNYAKHGVDKAVLFELGNTFHSNLPLPSERRDLSAYRKEGIEHTLSTLMAQLNIPYQISRDLKIVSGTTVIGELTPISFTLYTHLLLPLASPYGRVITEFSHPKILDISLIVPASLKYADILDALQGQKFHWAELTCKSVVKMGQGNNYLLQITWSESSKDVESDKKEMLDTLKNKLNIVSKS